MPAILTALLIASMAASPRVAADLRAGMELVYASNGVNQPPWRVEAAESGAALKDGADCARVRIRRQANQAEAVEERLCVDGDVLHGWDAGRSAWQPQRPVGAGMELRFPRPNGDIVHYATGAIAEEVVSGVRLQIVNTTVTTTDASGRPRRRLTERYSVTLTTATGGVFEVPDANAASGWRTEQRFELQEIRGAAVFPHERWQAIDRPESVGFSSQRLDAIRAWMGSLDTTAMMVVVGGRTLFSYGDVTHVSYLASGRKSVLSLLYGRYVENGTIALDRKLSDLQFTDVGGLMPREMDATIQHLLTARSGIYHPPSNGGDDTAHAPARGTVVPGERFVYNNWDFNAAGAVFEKLTGHDIYDALETDLARPIAMEDFDRARQRKSGNADVSRYPAYHVWLSTRDMARIGLLALREGQWGDRRVIPREWVRRATSLVTPHRDTNAAFPDSPPSVDRWGYGYLFWVWDADNPSDPLSGAYTAWGVGGQYITVVPRLDMVIAHKTDTGFGQGAASDAASGSVARQRPRAVTAAQYDAALRMLVAATCGDQCP